MAFERTRSLGNMTGAITLDGHFSTKFYGTLTGNTTVTFTGMDEGKVVTLRVIQDATAGRTLAITAAAAGANIVVGPSTAISAVAAKTSLLTIMKLGGIYIVQIIAQA
jgi:hypothetical protein